MEKEPIQYDRLGALVRDGYAREYACGCLSVEAAIQPILASCCHEHEKLLAGDMVITVPFGKHKGKKLDEVPYDYLVWLDDQDLDEPLKSKVHEMVNKDFA